MSRPPRKDPLARTRAPVPLPGARSRAALGLAAAAAEGVFALQVCAACGAVQYPPRDVCGACLGERLRRRPVADGGRLLAATTTRVSGERYFRERAPWRTGLVALDAGPRLVAHLHEACAVEGRVRLALRLDHAGRGAVFAFPAEGTSRPEDDPQVRELGADPRGRRVLIVDGRASTALALARALAEAGSPRLFVGLAEAWKPFPGRAALEAVPGVEVVPLDVAVARSVGDLAAQVGDRVEILVNNAAHVRPGGLVAQQQDPTVARETYEVACLGLLRLAAAFGPTLSARTADGPYPARAFVNLISCWALAAPPAWGAYGAAQAALRALSGALRRELRPAGLRVVDVLAGPLDDDWHQVVPPPKVRPEALAAALVAALREGREEVVVGDVARELHAKWAEDPRVLAREEP